MLPALNLPCLKASTECTDVCYMSLEDVRLCINLPVHAQGGYFLPSTSGFSTFP